ncbi:MAG: hypothetical protein WAL64_03690 [Candidatus Dormiibacterota bacterium]
MAETGSGTTGVISNKTAAAGNHALLRTYAREGRQSAYQATFQREVSPQEVIGPVVIESSAVRYGSEAGASDGFAEAKRQLTKSGWSQISTGSLGAQSFGFTETKALDQTEYQSFVVDWRQANVVNQIRVAGNAATMDLTYALTLARVQQRAEVHS